MSATLGEAPPAAASAAGLAVALPSAGENAAGCGPDWFSEFYQATCDAAYHYARLLSRDAVLAEDIVSDAYLRAWVNQSTLMNHPSRIGWVLTVIRNRVADEFRSRRITVDIEEVADLAEDGSSLPIELSEHDLESVRRAISRLTDEQQQVIFLRFFRQLPHEDVARELARNSNAVRAIQFRALNRLRTLLEAERAG